MNWYETLVARFKPKVGFQELGVSAIHKMDDFVVKSGRQVVVVGNLLLQIEFVAVR